MNKEITMELVKKAFDACCLANHISINFLTLELEVDEDIAKSILAKMVESGKLILFKGEKGLYRGGY